MSILVIDIEGTIDSEQDFAATPYDCANYPVAIGWYDADKDTSYKVLHAEDKSGVLVELLTDLWEADTLVFHNATYDLPYIVRMVLGFIPSALDKTMEEVGHKLANYTVWDTMVAEYYLTGQAEKMISLEKLAAKYHVPFTKDTEITEKFKQGIGPDKIDKENLLAYLKSDVLTTAEVFERQLLENPDKVPYLAELMRSIKATVMMMDAGMYVDSTKIKEGIEKLTNEIETRVKMMEGVFKHHIGVVCPVEFNPDSDAHHSLVLFGGTLSYDLKEQVGKYKTGKRVGEPRYIKKTYSTNVSPRNEAYRVETKKEGVYSVAQEVLEKLAPTHEYAKWLLEYRALAKNLSTYFQGYKDKLYEDGYLRTNYNHAVTTTKRLTSSGPNLQNVSNKGDK